MVKKYDAYEFKEYKLKNGLRVFYSHMPYATRTVFYSAMDVGSLDGKRGVSHFLEHNLIKKTKKFSTANEFDDFLHDAGGSRIDLFTNYYFTCLGISINSKNFRRALVATDQLFFNPIFNDENFTKEKKVIIEEIHEEIPRKKIIENYEEFYKLILNSKEEYSFLHRLRDPLVTLGNVEEIENLTIEDIINHWKSYYSINNLSIFVGSDLKWKKISKEVKKIFGKYVPNKDLLKTLEHRKDFTLQSKKQVLLKKDWPHLKIFLALRVRSRCHHVVKSIET